MNNYTKGEWYTVYDRENDSYHIYARQEKVSDIWITEIEDEANARLIAQSPRMAEWIAKVAKQGFTTFPEDRKVARELIY
ncbi:hypothetical protein LCGC14_0365860 [marine sediment metagenome]|uniref:Uncharacterized protein n=1 Tax=marine sediment metagenome TaxID=412755 RepID=A0A0F9TCP0_9ZZZZ